jgi:hypothetical protein
MCGRCHQLADMIEQRRFTAVSKPRAWLWPLAAVMAAVLAFGFFQAIRVLTQVEPATPTPAPAWDTAEGDDAPAPCDQAWSKEQAMIVGGSAALVRGMTATPDGVIIVVRPRSWAGLDVAAQEVLAARIDCAVAGPGSHVSAVRFRYELSGADLAAFYAPTLLDLRNRRLATP